MKTYKDLEVWRESISLVTLLYETTRHFPGAEIYGLTSQIRRAAVSIPANISEGSARKSSKEFRQFLIISSGSLSELETLLQIALKLSYLSSEEHQMYHGKIKHLTVMLTNLIKAIERKIQADSSQHH